MKKSMMVLVCIVLMAFLPLTVSAGDSSRSYQFVLAANGVQTVNASPGDVITVVFTLKRTDSNENALLYAMQNEIQYDPQFFEFVEGSQLLSDGIACTELGMRDGMRRMYMNFLSLDGGTEWAADTLVGSFQLKVVADRGVSEITSENYVVSTSDGQDRYEAEAVNLTVVLSTECTVRFESNGGTEVEDQVVYYGEKLDRPENPNREGMQLTGWYKDIDLKEEWNFDEDDVKSDIPLYAGWEAADAEDTDIADEQVPASVNQENSEKGCRLFPWILLILPAVAFLIWKYNKQRKAKQGRD